MASERCVCNKGTLTLRYEIEGKKIYECNFCELTTVRPLPNYDSLKSYYEENYASGRYSNRTYEYAVRLRKKTFKEWFRKIDGLLSRNGTLLDIGCGDGTAMDVADEYGFVVYGNDISENASKNAKKKWGERIYSGIPAENIKMENNFFDCIVMFDFIEHTTHPEQYFNLSYNLLKDNGKLVISTHDGKSIFKKLMGKSWSYLNPDEHLNIFTKTTLKIFLENAGFKINFVENVPKYVNLEFLYNELKWTSNFLYKIFSLTKKVIPSKLWDAGFYFYFGELLCVAEKVRK
jgi:2-polyprenyl-3-methyl-5-hydroxy-6-metoxy-1,4-benzoquinol methylase